MRTPILVTGSHRSGTTWAGKMLCLSGEAGYIHEPFNPRRIPGWAGGRIPYWYMHIDAANEDFYRDVVSDVLRFHYPGLRNLRELRGPRQLALYGSDLSRSLTYRARRLRPLVKDPIALFSAPWLAERFEAQVIVMIRHPAAFASSVKKLDWQFRFRSWLAQPALASALAPWKEQMHALWAEDADIVEQAIVMWNAIHHVIATYRDDHPEWSFIRHEDLSAAPGQGFRALYDKLGLTWSDRVGTGLSKATSDANPSEVSIRRHGSVRRDSAATATVWTKRLSPEEIERIRTGTAEVARLFYSDEELGL